MGHNLHYPETKYKEKRKKKDVIETRKQTDSLHERLPSVSAQNHAFATFDDVYKPDNLNHTLYVLSRYCCERLLSYSNDCQ